MTRRGSRCLRMILGLGLALWFGLAPVVSLAAGSGPSSPTGDYYIVQPGDTWANIAARNGLTASKLMAANPALLRPRSVIRPGDRMFIPLTARPAATSAIGYWYTVKPGDSWQTVSRDTGVAVLELWHANPSQLRPNRWLYIGTRLWIPAAAPAAGSPEPSTETALEVTTATAIPESAMPQPPVATTEPMTATAPITATVAPRASTTPSASTAATPAAGACPATLADYDAAIGARLNVPSASADALKSWLTQCGAIKPTAGSVTVAAIRAQGSHDVVVVLSDPAQNQPDAPGRILVYHALANGYVLTGVAQGQGKVTVLRVGDVNADGKADIVWTDAVCGPTVCYSTLFVDSWTGNNYQSWLQDQPITANAQYSFQSMAGASGLAIVITGTVGSSVAAPSTEAGARTFSESWISQKGGLYHRAVLIAVPAVAATPVAGSAPTAAPVPAASATPAASHGTPAAPATSPASGTPSVIRLPAVGQGGATTPAPATATAGQAQAATAPATGQATTTAVASQAQAAATPAAGPCLAARVQDANMIFNAWSSDGFGPAIQTYQKVLSDTPNTCGLDAGQVKHMLDFVRFRLMLASIGNGAAGQAPAYRDQIETADIQGLANAFMSSYADTHSLVQACRDTTTYTQAHPESWQFLAQGAAVSFAADDVCPLAK